MEKLIGGHGLPASLSSFAFARSSLLFFLGVFWWFCCCWSGVGVLFAAGCLEVVWLLFPFLGVLGLAPLPRGLLSLCAVFWRPFGLLLCFWVSSFGLFAVALDCAVLVRGVSFLLPLMSCCLALGVITNPTLSVYFRSI